ncbi:hypothetical protein D3C87_1280800 [compost metagenome]
MVKGTIGNIQGIRKARKPPMRPAIKVSQRVFSASEVFEFTPAVVAAAFFVVSTALFALSIFLRLSAFTGATAAVSVSEPISVNTRSSTEASASWAKAIVAEPKNRNSPSINIRTLKNNWWFSFIYYIFEYYFKRQIGW